MKLVKTTYKGVYLSDKGRYYINYKENGVSKRRVTTAGTAKEAFRLLNEKKSELLDIRDGKLSSVNIDRAIDTLDDLATVYFSLSQAVNKGQAQARYNKWVSPTLGAVKHPISLIELERLQNSIRHSTVNGTKQSGKVSRPIANATVNDIFTTITAMLNYGIARKLIHYIDGVPRVKRLTIDNNRERVLNTDEVELLIGTLDPKLGVGERMKEVNRRNRLVVLLGLYTGARPIHYLNLLARDIVVDSEGVPLRIRFSALKGAKAYEVPVSDKLRLALQVGLLDLKPDQRLFSASYQAMRKSVGKVLDKLFNSGLASYDVKHRVSLYTLRHSAASFMLSSTDNIYLVSKLLGHSSVVTTQRYAKVTDESLVSGINSY